MLEGVGEKAGHELAQTIAALPAELQPVIKLFMDRVDALEAKIASDESVIVDKVIRALVPQFQAITQTANQAIGDTLALIRRLDGAKVASTFELTLRPDENLLEKLASQTPPNTL